MFNFKQLTKPSTLLVIACVAVAPAHAELLGLKDPTIRSGGTTKAPIKKYRVKHKQTQSLKLGAIFSHADISKNRALINGHLAAVGDSIAGAKVLTINHRSIKVRYQGKERTLTTFRADIKKQPK